MQTYKALFLDIDGTILKPDHTMDQSTKDAVAQVKEHGMEVFLATGRPLHEIASIADELDIHSYIGYNGALALYQDQVIVNEPIDPNTIQHFLRVAKEKGHEMVLYTSKQNTFTTFDSPIVQEFIDTFKLEQNTLFSPTVIQDILGVTLMGLAPEDTALYQSSDELFFSQVNVAGLEHSYDVIRNTVNKGRAIQKLLEHLQIDKEKTIAFGDGMNDKEMLSYVGEGFAMGNAHPDLIAYANHQTTDVTDSGIYNGLQTLGLVK
ncbi:HAD family hydrolase [Radiobacillus kanasensis]|uniref:HAD family hydrolase n=1 Tax=Radiobacillus kanasensis TaxID=2844358 RepID=UPI001E480AD0|nr:HAD family hydrolase [Radiobacillus kanasensis]UFU00690.1 HAD family hydrolase [Radiobacillus kanasensis]